jgi:hypothetical protein
LAGRGWEVFSWRRLQEIGVSLWLGTRTSEIPFNEQAERGFSHQLSSESLQQSQALSAEIPSLASSSVLLSHLVDATLELIRLPALLSEALVSHSEILGQR